MKFHDKTYDISRQKLMTFQDKKLMTFQDKNL